MTQPQTQNPLVNTNNMMQNYEMMQNMMRMMTAQMA